jgi:hypothetical protein
MGIYFESGNTYDTFDQITGSYTLGGNLPEMATIGNVIGLGVYGNHEIVDIVYDETINKKAILINLFYDGLPIAWTVKSIFDLLPFEVYEFELDFNTIGNGLYDVLITNTDALSNDIYHLSPNILVEDSHSDTVGIRYFNSNNRDIFYKYGIEHFIRVPIIDFRAGVQDENEINITDLSTEVVASTVTELNEIEFDAVSVSMFRKLAIALSCKYVFINNVGYAKSGQLEVENLNKTNLISVIAKMIKTNRNYSINRQGQVGIDSGYVDFNIPAFITDDDTFIVEQ